jgi:hypothetical protein
MQTRAGDWRSNTEEHRSAAGWYATTWNHIEAGLAIMARLPVLLMADPDVVDGVFSRDVWVENVYGVPRLSVDDDLDTAHQSFQAWVRAVRGQAIRRLAAEEECLFSR